MKIIEKPELPKEIFATATSPQLLAQAVRVHLANQRQGTQSALTRADVNRTRKKLYKQKGTGGARHGDRKAPIFVGGGIAFAPKPRDYSLNFPQKMKKLALSSALTLKLKQKKLVIVSGMDKLTGKTAELVKFLATLDGDGRNLLIVTDIFRPNVLRAGRNISGMTVLPTDQLNTYEVLKSDKILLMDEAIAKIGQAQGEPKTANTKPTNRQVVKQSKAIVKKTAVKSPPTKKAIPKKIIPKKKTVKKTNKTK